MALFLFYEKNGGEKNNEKTNCIDGSYVDYIMYLIKSSSITVNWIIK